MCACAIWSQRQLAKMLFTIWNYLLFSLWLIFTRKPCILHHRLISQSIWWFLITLDGSLHVFCNVYTLSVYFFCNLNNYCSIISLFLIRLCCVCVFVFIPHELFSLPAVTLLNTSCTDNHTFKASWVLANTLTYSYLKRAWLMWCESVSVIRVMKS